METYLKQFADAQKYGVTRVAVNYRDDTGQSLVTVTAPTQTIADYRAGRISRDEFFKRIDARLDYDAIIRHELVAPFL